MVYETRLPPFINAFRFVFPLNLIFIQMSTQCMDRGGCVYCSQLHGHSRHELFLQLWVRLLESLQIPLSAGLRERQ